jgi:hypothetical protein
MRALRNPTPGRMVIETMRRAVTACLLASLLTACTGQGSSPPASTVASLLARPLTFPSVQSGSACPVTAVASRDVGIGSPRGRGPFYLGGGMPQGNVPWNKTVWVLADAAHGPVVFRGRRLDGTGSLKFSGSPADHTEKGVTLSSTGGVTATFYERMLAQGDGDAFYLYPATAGCYGLQVDGSTFGDVIVITAG